MTAAEPRGGCARDSYTEESSVTGPSERHSGTASNCVVLLIEDIVLVDVGLMR